MSRASLIEIERLQARVKELESERDQALKVLWSAGLSPTHHAELHQAALAVVSIVNKLRIEIGSPSTDVIENAMHQLGVDGYCDNPKMRLVEIEKPTTGRNRK